MIVNSGSRFVNGTIGLDVVLRALGLGPGDQVVLPAYNFYSLPKSVSNIGATPVIVDVCPENLTIDADQVREAIQRGAKAVVAVHISSAVAKLDELSAICRAGGAYLIEDCAQATGAQYGARHVGSWGDAGIFSFGGVKLMTSGQGGMITTSNPELYEKCYAIVNRGLTPTGNLNPHGLVGENYQLSDLAAVTLGPQLDVLADLCTEREAIMHFLDQTVETIEGVVPLKQFEKTTRRAQMRYTFLYKSERLDDTGQSNHLEQEGFIQAAQKNGIPLISGYKAVPNDNRLFQMYARDKMYPVAQSLQDMVVSIHHTDLLKGEAYWADRFDTFAGYFKSKTALGFSDSKGANMNSLVDENKPTGLNKADLSSDPIDQFKNWFDQAWAAKLPLPHAMTLATATKDGIPSARVVLLKGFDDQGFVFYTNYESRKGQDMAENPKAALVFYWEKLERQVRIAGDVSKVSQKDSEHYFATRPIGSRLGAWASRQSTVIPNRQVLVDQVEALTAKYPDGEIPLPPFWGGYRVAPTYLEFWQGRPDRLHDHFRYTRQPDGAWRLERLAP